MGYEWYISTTDMEIAKQNGISRATLEYRIHDLAWDKQKAITTPPKQYKSINAKWRELAKRNGIPYPAFQKRVNVYGWEPERAAKEQLQNRQEQIIKARKAQIEKRGTRV